jgi:uncharacterized membrane protein YhfC
VILLGIKNGLFPELVPTAEMPLVQQGIDEMFGIPWSTALLGAVERAFTLCFHLSASLLVLQAFLRRNILWFVAAIVWHTAVDATAVFTIQYLIPRTGTTTAALVTEAVIGVFAALSIVIIFRLRTPEPVEIVPEPLPPVGAAPPVELALTEEALEQSKYS